MDLGVAGKSYLIFGGTAGIGFEAAKVLAAEGARLVVVGRDAARAEAAAAELGGEAVGLAGDLTQPGAADELVATALLRQPDLRGMAITTGLGPRAHRELLAASDDDWQSSFDDVLMATVRACRAVVPVLEAGGGGSIVTTAAYSIRAPKPHQVPYATLKAGVATFTKDIAKGFGPAGIRANCVCPGATETAALASMRQHYANGRGWPVETALERVMAEEWGMKVALGRAGKPEEVGDLIAFLLSDRAAYLTGATINIDGGTDF